MRKLFKSLRFIIIIIILMLLIPLANQVSGNNFNLFRDSYDSKYIYVLDRENKDGLIKKNYKTKAYPASLTKVMTSLVALEHIDDLSAIAPINTRTYKKMVESNSSMAGFYSKETTTYRDLLYGTILSSGGEAANSLAIHIGGDLETFVKLMNDKAAEIGLKDTHFTNPEGLHDKDQYTTAYDMAKLIDYALDNGHFRAIFTKGSFNTTSTPEHPKGILLRSTVLSKLHGIGQNKFQIIGGKSGTTYEAGQCWATLAIKDNKEYIAIVMGSDLKDLRNPDDKHIEDTISIYNKIR